MSMDEAALNVAHLFRRAGFGAVNEEVELFKHWPWNDVVDMVLDTGRAPAPGPFPDLSENLGYHSRWVDMLHYWLEQARRPVDQAPVVEKMTLFWHGLLCSSMEKLFNHKMLMDQNHLFRVYGMGNYDTLLHHVSIGPAMIEYLDNDLNVAGSPNENFSRELMELFVTGVGHYTEDDVKESARAWTGHGVDDDRNYRFDGGAHDWGNKTFMGRTGNFDGPDIINIMFAERRTEHARFMCHRLWSFFAYPVDASDQVVTDIMSTYSSSLNIKDTLRAIFLHSEFRSEAAKTGLVRSPFEYVVAMMRHTSTNCSEAHPEWFLPGMGQMPFYPPNVSGWRQNDYWISAAAGWAKIHMAGHLRWLAYHRDDVKDLVDVTSYNPMTYKYTTEESVDKVLWNFKLGAINSDSRQKLLDFAQTERNSDHRWTERSGLLMLALLLPEMMRA
ncbi:MAG: DUF1800 family protein [Acidimicrobiales bacterium]